MAAVDKKKGCQEKALETAGKHLRTGKIKNWLVDLSQTVNILGHHRYQQDAAHQVIDLRKSINTQKIQSH